MSARLWTVVAVVFAALAHGAPTVVAQKVAPPAQDTRAIARTLGDQPLSFEANRGQADSRVRFLSRARDYTVALTDDEALLLVRKATLSSGRSPMQSRDVALMRMRITGGSRTPRVTASDPLPGRVYYAGASARGALTPIDTFARVEYAGVYPGIDLVYYGDDRRLEFDFLVAPFADPNQIALSLDGAEGIALTDAGDLSMRVGGTEVRLEKPFVYQERDGSRIEIPGAYVLAAHDPHTVRMRLGHYDPSLPLVIDPTWMSVFGSTSEDLLSGLVVDSAGNPRVLGMTFDPASFGFDRIDSGVLPPPNCFLTKFDATTGLSSYRILFANTQTCGNLALSPNDIAYFTGFFFPNFFLNNQGTTVTVVDDTSGVPVIRRFVVGNYDSSAAGEGVSALAVNSHENVFLIGPCRLVGAGEPALELSGYNETIELSQGTLAEGCSVPNQGFSELYQPLLTVVDGNGTFLYGSFLSPGDPVTRYGLAADDTDRAYIVGAQSLNLSPTADAYRTACPAAGTRGFDACGYLMVLDTTIVGPDSLAYASYLWNTEDVETTAVRLGPSGEVVIASEGRVFDDFPSNRPTTTLSWPYSLYPGSREGIQLARFDLDANAMPSQFAFGLVFDPSRAVAALAGQTVRDALADLRLFPSGAPAVASIAHTASSNPLGVVTTFSPYADRLGEVWVHNLGNQTPVFGLAVDSGGDLFTAGQIERLGAQDSDIFVGQTDSTDPGANRPPTVAIQSSFGHTITAYADSPSGGTVDLFSVASDPDGDALTYSWTGPFLNNPVTDGFSLSARLAVGTQHTITVTVDDGHGNIASASRTIDVVGTPFVNGTATPVDSTVNALITNYAPVTVTPAGLLAGPSNVYLRTRVDQIPPIPSNLQAGSPPIYFDVSTDAVILPPIAMCFDTRGMSLANPSSIRLYHYQQSAQPGTWTEITSPGYPQGNQICGQSNSLGTFAIFYPQVPPTAVRTIVGNGTLLGSIDGQGGNPADDHVDGPATSTALSYLHGGAFDAANNHVFISDGAYILRANLNNDTVVRVAGNGVSSPGSLDGPGGDPRDDLVEAGHAFNTYVGFPRELALSPTGDVVFYDGNTCRIRRLDLTQGRLFAVAGNGVCGFSGDGFSAGLASISLRGQIVFDAAGNLFFTDPSDGRVRRIDALTNVIDTVVGDGTYGIPINGAPAISTINGPTGIAFDSQGHLLVTGGLHLLRVSTGADTLVNGDSAETIGIVGGCNTNCQVPFNGDGLPVSNPQVYLPGIGSLTVARDGTVIFDDTTRIRSIAPGADGVVTGAGDEIISTIGGYFDWNTQITNFNGDTFSPQSLFGTFLVTFEDNEGRILVVDGNNYRVRRFGLAPPPANPNGVDLTLSVSTTPDPVNTGGSLRYFVIVTNNGPAVATGVTVTYAIPANAVFESAISQSGVQCTTPALGSSGTVTCDFGTLASGATDAIPIVITPLAAGSLSSSFTVSGAELDTNTADNIATATVTVNLAAAIIEVIEVVTVTDAIGVLRSAMIGLLETVIVSDTPSLLPSAMIGVSETVAVTDAPDASPLPANGPPLIDAGPDQIVEATSAAGASVSLSSSATDPDGDSLTLTWSGPCGIATGASVTLGCALGSHTVTFTADDGHGGVVSDTVNVTVRDTSAPVLTLPVGLYVPATSASGAAVSFDATATDIVSGSIAPSCSPASGATFAIDLTLVTCTATDAAGNPSTSRFFVVVFSNLTLQLPGNLTAFATSASGAVVTYSATARAIYGDTTTYPALCAPESGSTFPIGVTTVNCIAFQLRGTSPTGSFTVTVNIGAPSITAVIANKGRDPDGSFWVDLRLANGGTGHARNVRLTSLVFRTLNGIGTVTYNAARSGPLPYLVDALDVGQTRTVRLYLNVPPTVGRFSITENGALQNVVGGNFSFSFGQAVIP